MQRRPPELDGRFGRQRGVRVDHAQRQHADLAPTPIRAAPGICRRSSPDGEASPAAPRTPCARPGRPGATGTSRRRGYVGVSTIRSPSVRNSDWSTLTSCAMLAITSLSAWRLKVSSVIAATSASRRVFCCQRCAGCARASAECHVPHSSTTSPILSLGVELVHDGALVVDQLSPPRRPCRAVRTTGLSNTRSRVPGGAAVVVRGDSRGCGSSSAVGGRLCEEPARPVERRCRRGRRRSGSGVPPNSRRYVGEPRYSAA